MILAMETGREAMWKDCYGQFGWSGEESYGKVMEGNTTALLIRPVSKMVGLVET